MATTKYRWSRKHYWGKYFGTLIDLELDQIREYLVEVHDGFKKKYDRVGARYKEATKEMSDDKAQEMAELFIEDAANFSEGFPKLTNAATFVTIYSYFEFQLLLTCKKLRGFSQLEAEVNLKGGAAHSKKYLIDAGIRFPERSKEWLRRLKLRAVRNMIVHHGSRLKRPKPGRPLDPNSKDAQVFTFLSRTKSATVEKNGEFWLSVEFCFAAIEDIRRFMKKLVKRLPPEQQEKKQNGC
jgi:hypothetical protein